MTPNSTISNSSSFSKTTPLPNISLPKDNFSSDLLESLPSTNLFSSSSEEESRKVVRYKAILYQMHRHLAASEQEKRVLLERFTKLEETMDQFETFLKNTNSDDEFVAAVLKRVQAQRKLVRSTLESPLTASADQLYIPETLSRRWSSKQQASIEDLWRDPKGILDPVRLHALEEKLSCLSVKLYKLANDKNASLAELLGKEAVELDDLVSSLAILLPIRPMSKKSNVILEKDHPEVVNAIVDSLVKGKLTASDAKIKLCQVFSAQRLRFEQEKGLLINK